MTTSEFDAELNERVELNITISHVWQERDPVKLGQILTKYRLVDNNTNRPIGIFQTPQGSFLSQALLEESKRK